MLDAVADDLAYVSRREIHRPPDARRRYSHGFASVVAALLLRRLTGSEADLPRVATPTVESAREIVDAVAVCLRHTLAQRRPSYKVTVRSRAPGRRTVPIQPSLVRRRRIAFGPTRAVHRYPGWSA